MKAAKTSPHFTIDFLIMFVKNINFSEILNVYILAAYLYIPIFTVIKDIIRESVTGFLYKV